MVPAEEIRKVICEYFDRLLNQHDLSVCDELLAADYVDHDDVDGFPPGLEDPKTFVSGLLESYPDIHVDVKDVVIEGDRAAVRLHWEGTHAETGETLEREGIIILRMDEDGRVAERWSACR